MTAYLAPQFDTQFFDGSTVAAGYKLYTYDSGTTTPKAVYSDQAGTVPHTNPIVLDANGRVTGQMFLGSGEYTFTLKTDADVLVKTWNDVAGASTTVDDALIRSDLASTSDASKGAGMVGFIQSGAGSVPTTVYEKLSESVDAKNDFGAIGDGVTNDTSAILAFFTHCISSGVPGHIPRGDYLVTPGILAFDNGFTDKVWPNITTDGYRAVRFLRADATDAPIISITNGTASSAVAKTWLGGSLGGLTFDQNGKVTASGQHGLVLSGMVGTRFGYMRANGIGGSCVFIEQKLYGGSNPDPYHVTACVFDGVEGVGCGGWSFCNNNYVGLSGCTILSLTATSNQSGAFYGFGANNRVNEMSVGSCGGWALGNNTDAIGGSASRFTLGVAEFDDVQYGVDIRRVSASDFGTIRFVHRYNFSALNPSGGYWPRIAVQAGTVATVNMISLKIIDRIESGGSKVDMGSLFDFANAGGQLVDLLVRRQLIDNAGFGFSLSEYYSNYNGNTRVSYTDLYGAPVIDSIGKTVAIARAENTYSVPNSGFLGAGNTVRYSTELSDPSGCYDASTWTYTSRSPGQYRVTAAITLAVAIGTRVRLAIVVNGTASTARYHYATTANPCAYEIDAVVDVSAGAAITINADQNSAGAVSVTSNISANENQLSVVQI